MTIITICLAIVTLLNALISVVGAIYAFATIRGNTAAFWMVGQVLLVLLTLASPFTLALTRNYFGADIETAVFSQNLLIAVVALIVSILFVLMVARIDRLKSSGGSSAPLP